MGGRFGKVRLIDVAEAAGVSMKTVSNVVHDYPHVSPGLRRRVQQVIEELGYRPNVTARRLVAGRTGMVSLAIPFIDQPYFAELARQVGEEARRRGYRVLVEETLDSVTVERAVLRDRDEGLVDGMLFHPVHIQAPEIAQLRPDTPVVLLGESPAPATTDSVMIDNRAAARDGVDLLLSQGRCRVVFLGTVLDDISGATELRLQGYRQALGAAGIPLADELVLGTDGFAAEDAQATLIEAIDAGLEFDAVMCRDDLFAVGALKALARAGRAVPEDVAVVGWDDTTLARFSSPTLTSISPDKRGLARCALDLLEGRMAGFSGGGRHTLVAHTLIERESTGLRADTTADRVHEAGPATQSTQRRSSR